MEKAKLSYSKNDSFGSNQKEKLTLLQPSKGFFDVSPIGYFITSTDGIIHDTNPAVN